MNEAIGSETLVRLSDVEDLEIADDDPNPIGWTVYANGARVGRVTDLLVDTAAMRVRFLEVERDAVSGSAEAAELHIPVERVNLVNDAKTVELLGTDGLGLESSAGFAEAGRVPSSMPGNSGTIADREDTAARVTRSEEELRVGTREVQAGEVVVQKHVETEHVHEPVATRVERVRIQRRPAGVATAASDQVLGENEIRVPVMSEEVVVEKRPVVKEEIVITKEVATETKDVEADLRKERVDVRTTGEAATTTEGLSEEETRRARTARGGSRG